MKRNRLQTVLTVGLVVKLIAVALALIAAGPLATPGPQEVRAEEKAGGKEDKPMEGAAEAVAKRQKAAQKKDGQGAGYVEPAPQAQEAPTYDPMLMKLIDQKRSELNEREARLEQERRELESLRGEVNQRIAELKKVQDALEQLIVAENKERKKRTMQLVKVLQNMRGPAAAKVVERLDDQMAVEIFMMLQARQAGKIMSSLKPDQAARIGELIAQRKKAEAAAKVAGQAAASGAQPPAGQPAPAGKPAGQ